MTVTEAALPLAATPGRLVLWPRQLLSRTEHLADTGILLRIKYPGDGFCWEIQ